MNEIPNSSAILILVSSLLNFSLTSVDKILLIVFDFRSFISPKDRTIKSRYTYKKNGLFYLGQNSMPLKSATIVKMDENGRSTVQESKLRDDGIARVIFLQDAKAFIVCDERSFLSSYIQMYLFDNYDTKYFEPIVSSQLVKIYKVKR